MSSKNPLQKDPPESIQETTNNPPRGQESTPELTREKVDELKAKAAKADDHWERFLRVTADLENFRKRAARERQDALRFANESLLTKLIPVLDSLEMALAATESPDGVTVESLKTGVTMILGQLKNAMTEAGLDEVDATRQTFNPNLHEAVSQEPSNEVPEGHVVRQLRRGYKLHERLIRPATVVVARNSPA